MSFPQDTVRPSTEVDRSEVDQSERTSVETRWTHRLEAAVPAGVVAGALFGAMLPSAVFMPTFAELYAGPSVVGGWVVHFFHSIAFALLYALLSDRLPRLASLAADPARGGLLGICYGLAVWLVTTTVVFPVWLDVVGVHSLPLPYLQELLLLGHVVYGATLGAVYPILVRSGEWRSNEV